jgi:ABC-2 type transport system permease protein
MSAVLDAPSAALRVVRRPWRTVLACELTLVRRDAGVWLAMLLVLACVAYALAAGHQREAERASAVAAAQQDEVTRRSALLLQAQRIERGEAAAPSEPFRDPTNALAVGRGSGAAVVRLPPSALAATAVGVSDMFPPSFRVVAGSRDRFLFVDEIANPTLLAGGNFDLAFVVVVLLPLVLLALSYDVLSGEREQGTWALTLASSAAPFQVLAIKLLARAAPVLLVLLGCTVGGLLLLGSPLGAASPGAVATSALALTAWCALVVVYAAFWLALALCVNAAGRDSAFNAVALVLAWVLLVLVAPAAINAVGEALHPAPARAEMVLAVRQAAVDADRDRDAERARFRAEHGMAQPGDAQTRERRALALLQAADKRADDVIARHDAEVRANRSTVERLAIVSPAVMLNDALAALAGNGPDRWDAFLTDVDAFHQRWQAFFVDYAQRGARLPSADQPLFPRFQASIPDVWVDGVAQRVALTAAQLMAACVVLLVWGARRLRTTRS